MLKNRKKLLTLLLAILCLALCACLLFACGKNDDGTGGGNGGEDGSGGESWTPNANVDYSTVPPLIDLTVSDVKVKGKMGEKKSRASVSFNIDYTIYPSHTDARAGKYYAKLNKNCSLSLSDFAEKEDTGGNSEYIDSDFSQNIGDFDFTDWILKFLYEHVINNDILSYRQEAVDGWYDGYSYSDVKQFFGQVVNGEIIPSLQSIRVTSDDVQLENNEDSPIEIELSTDMNALFKSLTPYTVFGFDKEITFLNDYRACLTADDCKGLDSRLVTDKGIYVGVESFSVPVTKKGVSYILKGKAYLSKLYNFRLDGCSLYYTCGVSDKVFASSDTITGASNDGHPVNFDVKLIESVDLTQFKLKLYKDASFTDYTTETIGVDGFNKEIQSFDLSIPTMNVAEIDERLSDVTVTLHYENDVTFRLSGDEINAGSIKNQSTSTSWDAALKSMSASPTHSEREKTFYIYLNSDLKTTVDINFTEAFGYATFNDKSLLKETMYEYQAFTVPEGLKIIEHYYNSYDNYKHDYVARTETVDVYDGLFDDLTEDYLTAGKTYSVKLRKQDMCYPEKCDEYTLEVAEDSVTAIDVKLDIFFGGIILNEPVNFDNCTLTATFSHGQTATLPLTEEMLGFYSNSQLGEQNVEIIFRGVSEQVPMSVRKVKQFSVAEGLDTYYLLNDTPDFSDVWLEVTFEQEDENDYVQLPEKRIQGFDLTTAGSKSVNLTFGGVEKPFSYRVIEGVYITYTVTDDKITLKKFNFGTPAEGVAAFIPDDVKNIVLPEKITVTYEDETTSELPVVATAKDLFKNQNILRTLVVPECIQTIGEGLVDGCGNLETLTVSGLVPLKQFFSPYEKGTIASPKKKYPNIPAKLEVVVSGDSVCDGFLDELYCYESGKYIQKLTLGDKVTSLGAQSSFSNVKEYSDGGSEAVYVKDNVIYTDGGSTLLYYSSYKITEAFIIPTGVATANIGENKYIKSLTVPSSVTTLCEDFLRMSEALETVVFEAESQVTELPDGAFQYCSGLKTFNFPDNLQAIGDGVLSEVNMEKIIIPHTVTSVGYMPFNNAKCKYFYIPTEATNLFAATQGYGTIKLPNLEALAYDGSIQFTKLIMAAPSDNGNYQYKLYITGEKQDIGNLWYTSSYADIRLSAVYVASGTTFNKYYYSGTIVYEPFDKWWIA